MDIQITELNELVIFLKHRQQDDNRVTELVNRRDRRQIWQPQHELGTAAAEEHFQLFISF